VCASPNLPLITAALAADPEYLNGVRNIGETVLCRYFASPRFSLIGFNLNGYPTAIADQVMVMVLRAVPV
jgi:hypothetical protein